MEGELENLETEFTAASKTNGQTELRLARIDGVEPEPVGRVQHHTIGGRGAVARLREET